MNEYKPSRLWRDRGEFPMTKPLITLLGASLIFLSLSTPTFAQQAPDPCADVSDDASCLDLLRVLAPQLMLKSMKDDERIGQLERDQAKAIDGGDASEIERLRHELQTVIAERDQAKAALEAAKARIAQLEREHETLSGKVDELTGIVTELLERETPVAETEPEPTKPVVDPQPAPQLVSHQQPALDPSIYGRMGWRDGTPSIPSPVVHPDIRWTDAGNCQTFRNIASTGESASYVFINVEGVDFAVDSSGYTMSEVLLGPGQRVSWCSQDGDSIISLTPARESTASSSERQWDGRRWVSVERSRHACNNMRLRSGRDGNYGKGSCSASW